VALHRLDAAHGEHHRPRREGEVGALDDALHHIESVRDLARRAELDVRPQSGSDQAVLHHHQALGEGHADMVDEFLRGRTGTAL